MADGSDGKLILIREYMATMRARSEALRGRALQVPMTEHGSAAAEALEELETAQEELRIADDELRTQGEELERIRQAVSAELRRFRDLFDHAPDGYAETDPRGVVRLANRTLAADLSILPQFLQQKPLINFVARGDCAAFRAALVKLGEGSPLLSLGVHLRPRQGGKPFPVDMRARAVTGPAQKVIALRWAIRTVHPPSL